METSFPIFPNNEQLKKLIRVPSVISLTPCQTEIDTCFETSTKNLTSCHVCHALLSPLCVVSESYWECQICGNKNKFGPNEFAQIQMKHRNWECVFRKSDNNPLIYALYLSLNFKNLEEFARAKIFAFSILRHMDKDSRCLVFIGTDDAAYSVLIPPKKMNSDEINLTENEIKTTFKEKCEKNEIKTTTKEKCEKNDNSKNEINEEESNGLCAALARFSSINAFIGLDLSYFFFSNENEVYAERAIDKLSFSFDSNPVIKISEISITFARVLEETPLRVFGLIAEFTLSSPIFDAMRNYLLRIDFIVANFNKNSLSISEGNQGTIHPFSTTNPALQALMLLRQQTFFQLLIRFQGSMTGLEWKKLHHPFSDISDSSVLFVPVCVFPDQSFAIEVMPLPNQKKVIFQSTVNFITSIGNKTYFVYRSFNFECGTSDDFEKVTSNINWNCVFWYWVRLLVNKSHNESVAMIFRSSAAIVSSFEMNFNIKMSDDFLRAVCLFPQLKVICDDALKKWEGIELWSLMPPRKLNFVPKKIDDIDGYLSPNGISVVASEAVNKRRAILEIQKKYPFYLICEEKIPKGFTRIDEEWLQKLNSIVEQLSVS